MRGRSVTAVMAIVPVLFWSLPATAARTATPMDGQRQLLDKYCLDCHKYDKNSGGLSLMGAAHKGRVGVQSAIPHPDTAEPIRRLMTARNLRVPPEGRTLDSICVTDLCK
jgi:hypothetical protein